MTGTNLTEEKLISWCEHGKMLVCEICALKTEVKTLKQQVNTHKHQLEVQTKAAEIGAKNLVVAEQQVKTLTEALRSCVWELQQWVKSFHPEAHDEGKKIAHEIIEKSYKALQSIKESPTKENRNDA